MKKLTDRQREILHFIYDYLQDSMYPPTVREIGEAVGLSSASTVHGHLTRLADYGYIVRDKSKPRAIELLPEAYEALGLQSDQIPLVGTVTAGEPILATQNIVDYFPKPSEWQSKDDQLFMLTIQGTSMIQAGILDGDQVIVKQTSSANNGDIVIAMTENDEATCKRFFKEDGYFRLQPENDALDPIILDHVTILGKVVGLYRPRVY
ncbi:transcriptional repressor LexA [Atopobacter sp. AH10]|uniref:transcriptional repressor LexA n=1 Tax=Atopobacter sp. AH10 TaxID=2315861 RepID=UPI000EF285E4|nr:transcriptional repressor LexA [Atopobacter sp. AH10]RLK62508.1 transcriptional repressor LexA [Atopobacter sp. AH10]